MCLWEIFEKYDCIQIPQSHSRKTEEEFIDDDENTAVLLFHPSHPKYLTYCLKYCSKSITPVLLGQAIAHHDKEDSSMHMQLLC